MNHNLDLLIVAEDLRVDQESCTDSLENGLDAECRTQLGDEEHVSQDMARLYYLDDQLTGLRITPKLATTRPGQTSLDDVRGDHLNRSTLVISLMFAMLLNRLAQRTSRCNGVLSS